MALRLLQAASNILRGDIESGKKKLRGDIESGKKKRKINRSPEPSEMNNDMHFEYSEFQLGKRVLREYSNYEGEFDQFNHRGRYWSIDMWNKLAERYNVLRLQVPGVRPRPRPLQVYEFVSLCKQLQSQYCNLREYNEGYGHTDMEDVFSPCEQCQVRIPVFPNKFGRNPTPHQSPCASNSNSNSGQGQRRTYEDAFGNNNIPTIPTNHSSSVSQLGIDIRMMVCKVLQEMKEKGYVTVAQYCIIIGKPAILDALWPSYILNESVTLSERARNVIHAFCDRASTSRQH